MGTDIHGVFQKRTADGWEDVPSTYEQDRHYQLFAVLAGVRNGYGFAGVPTGEAVGPISTPRGLPDDFALSGDAHPVASVELLGRRAKYHEAGEPVEVWMGDHSHSWLSGAEMLAWQPPEVVLKTGIITRDNYRTWTGGPPEGGWCGGISGPGVIVVNDNAIERENTTHWTHIRVTWEKGLREECAYFFDEVARLVAEHGELRFVFGFDS